MLVVKEIYFTPKNSKLLQKYFLQEVKCANNFPSDSRNNTNDAGSAPAASNCTASFYMLTGQKIRPEAWIDLDPGQQKLFNSTASGSGATLNSYYNNMTIIEN